VHDELVCLLFRVVMSCRDHVVSLVRATAVKIEFIAVFVAFYIMMDSKCVKSKLCLNLADAAGVNTRRQVSCHIVKFVELLFGLANCSDLNAF
jgi:hypothetical protein